MKQLTGKDGRALREALDNSGALKRCVQAVREQKDREIRLAQAEERRERERAIRPQDRGRATWHKQ